MQRIKTAVVDADRALDACRQACPAWAREPLSSRLAIVRRARRLMARHATALAATVTRRPIRDTLVAEVLPLLDAIRFLERRAMGLLASKTLRGGRPLWLFGVSAEIHREPLGVILILGPDNYPLFLPCVQAIQALVAGNTVCLKPAPGGEAAVAAVAKVLYESGLPPDALRLLEANSGAAAAACKFDRIILTGSAPTGASVLEAAAPQLTPSTMELSGCDAAYVMDGADVSLVARCLAYGLTLNGGASCIAPRRVFVLDKMATAVEQSLLEALPDGLAALLPAPIEQRLASLLGQAAQAGARIVRSALDRPVVVANARCDMQLLHHDVFAPWLAFVPVPDMATALRESRRCPYALGASIFGPAKQARKLARHVNAGSICINDVIVPTADPRLPFGGSGRSGFGRTRGAEGLLEMTSTKSVSVRRGRLMPHLAPPDPRDEARFATLIRLLHADWWMPQ